LGQFLLEREIQITACRYVDEVMVYDTEADLIDILDSVEWDVRILGDEYQDKDFTGRDKYLDKCYFNKRPHTFSSSELRERVAEKEASNDS
jgi:glycerol-3-phosphate cytidylyltransferase